nr:hypothetical protein CFP56_10226 [Quercus suber]
MIKIAGPGRVCRPQGRGALDVVTSRQCPQLCPCNLANSAGPRSELINDSPGSRRSESSSARCDLMSNDDAFALLVLSSSSNRWRRSRWDIFRRADLLRSVKVDMNSLQATRMICDPDEQCRLAGEDQQTLLGRAVQYRYHPDAAVNIYPSTNLPPSSRNRNNNQRSTSSVEQAISSFACIHTCMHVQPLLAAPSLMKAPGSSSRSTMSVLRRTPCPRVVPRITAQSFPPSSRAFYAGRAHAQSATMLSLQISSGENAEDVRAQATALIQSGRWQLCDEGRGMERTFKFKGFKSTWVGLSASFSNRSRAFSQDPIEKRKKVSATTTRSGRTSTTPRTSAGPRINPSDSPPKTRIWRASATKRVRGSVRNRRVRARRRRNVMGMEEKGDDHDHRVSRGLGTDHHQPDIAIDVKRASHRSWIASRISSPDHPTLNAFVSQASTLPHSSSSTKSSNVRPLTRIPRSSTHLSKLPYTPFLRDEKVKASRGEIREVIAGVLREREGDESHHSGYKWCTAGKRSHRKKHCRLC